MKKILAIDDQQDNLTTLKAVIKTQLPDCIVLTALSGAEGIDIAQKEQPDTILLDIIMPQMDGYEVCKLLKDKETTKHIPIIMLTAIKTDADSRVKGLNLGADAFLAKPIDHTELAAQVKVMFRIKEAEDILRHDKYDLEKLVEERTEKLRESEEKYKALYENAPLPYQSLNEDGSFRDVNPAWLDTLGYKREEVIGANYIDFLHPDWQEHFEKNFPAFKKRGYVSDVQFKIRHKDGHYLDISFEGCIGYHPDGSFRQTYCVFQDITERKFVETALKVSEEQYKYLFNSIRDAILVADKDRNIIDCNTAFTSIFGYSRNEIIGRKTLYCYENEEQFTALGNALNENLIKSTPFLYTVNYKKKNNDVFPGETGVHYLKDREDKVTGFIGLIRDVTERKLAETALKESEEKFRKAFMTSPDSININRLDDGTFVTINQGFTQIMGYTEEDVLGKTSIEINIWKNPDDRLKLLVGLKDNGIVENFETEFCAKNGDIKNGLMSATVIELDGKSHILSITRDITIRKKALAGIMQRESLLKAIFDSTADGLLVVDNKGVVTHKNTEFLKMWRIPSNLHNSEDDDLLIKTVLDQLIDPAQFVSKVKKLYNSALIDRDMLHFKDGRIFERNSQPLIIEDIVVGRVWNFSDITERRKAEKALFESEQRFSKLIQQSPFIIEIYDSQGLQVSVNTAYENLWGFPASQTVNKFNVLKSKEVEKTGLIKYVKQAYNGRAVSVPEYQFDPTGETEARGIGRVRWLSTKIFPLKDPLGIVSNIVIMHEDATNRKRSDQIQKVLYNISDTVISSNNIEELISIIKDHLSTIIDTTNYYIGLYDDQTKMISLPFVADEKDEIESFPAEDSLTGHVIRTQKSLLVTADQQEEMVKKGIIKFVGTRSQVWLGVPLTIDGVVKGVLAVQSYSDKNAYNESDREILEFVSDQISLSIERKQKEQELIKALEKATESDRLKSSFLATMSHELRTPLNAIIGFSDIITEDLPIAEIIEFNQTINSSGNHLLTIVEDLFDITLIETGEIKIIKDTVNINSLLYEVKEIIKIEQSNLKKEHLELNLLIPDEGKKLMVRTDPWRLKQILINLLKNALKFTHKGSVNFGFEINSQDGINFLQFFVKDTGIGIPKDKQELIFDVFRQIEDSHTRTYGGTGIGLSISRRLAELLRGRMWVDSDKNGSSFYFTIPFEMIGDLNEPKIKAESGIASNGNITVLVVEDDESSFEFLKVVLKKTAQFILWAQNGEEAVTLCKNDPDIDIVLMDINMPVMNGYDATKAIKAFRPTLPIIAQTAYAIAGDREKSIEVGCDEYISKPIKREELLDKIKKLLLGK